MATLLHIYIYGGIVFIILNVLIAINRRTLTAIQDGGFMSWFIPFAVLGVMFALVWPIMAVWQVAAFLIAGVLTLAGRDTSHD